jgi:endonuclease/exonuclease/phosphatase family metal-dependent hydrolase
MIYAQDWRTGPDIIGMQEVKRKQLKSLRNNWLAGYSCFAEKRGGPWTRNPGERLAIFYRSRRLQQLDSGSATINHKRRRKKGGCEDTYVSRGGDHSHRIIIWVRFRDLETDRTFYVFNAHFGGKDDCEKRGNSNFLIELIENRSHAEDPFIILGDLNIGQTDTNTYNSAFLDLLRHTRLKNAYRRVHSENSPEAFTTVNTYYPGNHQNQMIDFILIPPLIFQVRDADVDRSMFTTDGGLLECRRISRNRCRPGRTQYNISDLRMYSDHWAVWAELV